MPPLRSRLDKGAAARGAGSGDGAAAARTGEVGQARGRARRHTLTACCCARRPGIGVATEGGTPTRITGTRPASRSSTKAPSTRCCGTSGKQAAPRGRDPASADALAGAAAASIAAREDGAAHTHVTRPRPDHAADARQTVSALPPRRTLAGGRAAALGARCRAPDRANAGGAAADRGVLDVSNISAVADDVERWLEAHELGEVPASRAWGREAAATARDLASCVLSLQFGGCLPRTTSRATSCSTLTTTHCGRWGSAAGKRLKVRAVRAVEERVRAP